MKSGNLITIIPSAALSEIGLEDLAGKTATIIEVKYNHNGTVRGCWVLLTGEPFKGEPEWYVPRNSISE